MLSQPDSNQLVKALWPVEVLEAKISEFEPRVAIPWCQLNGGSRSDHLATVSHSRNASRPMDVHPHIPVVHRHWSARVKTHTYPKGGVPRPAVSGQCLLDSGCRADRMTGRREGEETGIALSVDQNALVALGHVHYQLMVLRQEFPVGVAERVEQSSRPLDVSEHQRDGSAW